MLVRWFIGMCDRVCAVLGAFAFSQVPLFYQQYTQRLAGHLAEAQLQVSLLQQAADRSGKTLQMYIAKFLGQADQDFTIQGQLMEGTLTRFSSLNHAYEMLSTATPWSRPYYFAQYSHLDITEAAFRDFSPGISMTLESALYAAIGMFFGYTIFRSLRYLLRLSMRLGKALRRRTFASLSG
jgi:hypothetical protein